MEAHLARILVIDDDLAVSMTMAVVLKRNCHDVILANSGREGFSYFMLVISIC